MSTFRWTAAEVGRALELGGGEPGQGRAFARVWTDTRSIQAGDLFVALQGERFDAHDFLGRAAEAGAAGAVVARVPEGAPQSLRYFVVPDTLAALGRLGRHRRERLDARVVAVAGSNGKTTTKDLVRAALGARFRVHATEGNYNNQIGVPLTLLAAPDDTEALVVEIGTNEPGEIAILADIVRPDAGIITSIGEEHLEKLGSLEGVLAEETALLAGLGPEGIGLVAEEPPALPQRARELRGGAPLWVAGFGEQADLRPDGGADGVAVLPDGSTRWSWQGARLHLPLPGRYNVRNALLALGLARAWGVPAAEAAAGLERVASPSLRGEWRRIGDLRALADCYNANPPSVTASLELLAGIPAPGRKVAVLGTMRELGEAGPALHRRVAELAAGYLDRGIDTLVATGDFVAAFEPDAERLGPRLIRAEDPLDAFRAVRPLLRGDETILLKGSRGVALERWLELLEQTV